MLTDTEIPTWALDLPPDSDRVPDPPDWPRPSLEDLAQFSAPDCPCCVEPIAPTPEPARWATPGVTWHNDEPPPRPPVSARVAAVTTAIAALAEHDTACLDELQAVVDVEALLGALRDLRIGLLPPLRR